MQPPRYILHTHKASVSLKALHNTVLMLAEYAVRAGDATPAAVLAELRHVLAVISDRWRGKARHEVLNMAPTKGQP